MNDQANASDISQGFQAWSQLSHQSMEAASALFTDWLQDASDLQKYLLAFFNQRMVKDVDLLERFADCTSVGGLVDLQAEMLTGMIADYAQGGQKVLVLLADAAQRHWNSLDMATPSSVPARH